ncbi:MAG: glycosyltransferase, exosortase A system-associated [Burkholderiales bacterium]|nr:glycosyltransferase, exosortase A system-associated [Burkholderiales bacterium]
MKPRVLHVLDHSIPLHSGYTFRTAAILREQRALGMETFHITSPKHTAATSAHEQVDGLAFYRTEQRLPRVLDRPVLRESMLMRALERRLDEVAAEVKPNVIHAHSPVLNAIPAVRVGRRRGIPVVYEVRAFWEDAAVDHGTTTEGSLRYRATRALETWALKRADAVTCICEGLRADIAARGVDPVRITVIPNAVDVEKFSVDSVPDAALRAKLGLSGSLVLGFLGSFYAYEGLPLVLEALARLLAKGIDVRALLIGGGPQDEELRRRAAPLGDRVVMPGRVPHADVMRYYDLIDLLVYPRLSMRLTDLVTPLKPLEAMAQGRIVVASDVGGHRELIRDGSTGFLFRAGSADALAQTVETLAAQRERWPAIRAAGRQFVEIERNWQGSVARYVPIYGRLVTG